MHSVETILTVLTARLLHKGTVLQQRTVFLLQKKKTFAAWKYWKDSWIVPKKFEQKTVEWSFFYGPGSDRMLGNDKGVGVAVFTNRKVTVK